MTLRDRALGAWYGQLIGDNLGALVEFCSPEQIAQRYPDGVREMADGGTHDIAAGQPTDDFGAGAGVGAVAGPQRRL